MDLKQATHLRDTEPAMLEKWTLVSQVYSRLRERIVNLSVKPGARINIKQLAQEFSVSQTPIREALQKLIEQGLVVSRPYVGYFVVQLTSKDVQELFDLRKSLETLAMKYALENTDEEKLEALLRQLRDLERNSSLLENTWKFDEDFHLGFLIKGSGNKWLEKFANGVIDPIKLTARLSVNPKVACVEHREILEAIACRDLDRAITALETHLERSKQDVILALTAEKRVTLKRTNVY